MIQSKGTLEEINVFSEYIEKHINLNLSILLGSIVGAGFSFFIVLILQDPSWSLITPISMIASSVIAIAVFDYVNNRSREKDLRVYQAHIEFLRREASQLKGIAPSEHESLMWDYYSSSIRKPPRF